MGLNYRLSIFLFLIYAYNSSYSQTTPIQWSQCYGGTEDERANDIIQTADSGYLVVGSTTSNDGDVSGFHGSSDAWVVKTDTNGNIEWQKSLGGSFSENFSSAIETKKGDFLLAGVTGSDNGNVSGHHGLADTYDLWVVMLNKHGNLIWQKCFGGTGDESASAVKLTSGGDYIIVGGTGSNDGDVSGNHGTNGTNAPFEVWAIQIDSLGNLKWQKCFGGTNVEDGKDIIGTENGDFVIAATTYSNNGDVIGNHGAEDWWIFRIDSIGNIKWQKCLGGTEQDYVAALCASNDGGYIITGQSRSHDGDVQGNHKDSVLTFFNNDFLTIKLDSVGNKVWQKCYGGNFNEMAYNITPSKEGNYVITGEVNSWDGDVVGYAHLPLEDYWVVCIDSVGNIIWQKCLGGQAHDLPRAVIQTYDRGFIVAGESNSNDGDVIGCHSPVYDFWVVKLLFDSAFLNILPINFNMEAAIYPNPATDQLFIETYGTTVTGIDICNSTGVLVSQSRQWTNSVDVSKLTNGLYIVKIKTKEGNASRRWIKM